MHQTRIFQKNWPAALLVALLASFLLSAQAAWGQVVTNTAQAEWDFSGSSFSTQSNTVSFEIEQFAPEIEAFSPTDGSGQQIDFQSPLCQSSQIGTSGNGSGQGTQSVLVQPTEIIRAGEDLIFQVRATAGNLDTEAVDSLIAVLENSSGDREEIEIFETGPNTATFVGRIPTVRVPPSVVQNDCRMSLVDGDTINIAAQLDENSAIIISTDVEVLADPFGVVFDSETGDAVSGATVTIVDAVTGQPATVFAPDGTTPWPSTIISGQPITDASGAVTQMGPGEYWFPLLPLGTYRIEIDPPAPYSAPSVVGPAQIASLTRPGGGSFVISDASYGGTLTLADATPIQVDIPVDRPSLAISLTKSASRPNAQPGDAVFYTIIARNQDPTRAKRSVTLADTPSRWLRLRQDSIRVDGQPAPNSVTITPDGRTLTLDLGDVAGGATRRITYAMVVRADAPPGEAVNRAETTDSLGRTSAASAVIDIERDTIAGRMTIIGRITAGSCSIHDNRIGIPGVRVMLEDGSFAVTDIDGRYHFEGVVPGTHVVHVAERTLPEGGRFVDCHRSTRSSGSAKTRFVIGQGGSLAVADFHATVPEAALARPVPEPDTVAAAGDAELGGRDTEISAAETIGDVDWLALGDGPDGWLFPEVDHNPRAPAVRAAIRHRKGQTVRLYVDGKPVDPLAFDGTRTADKGKYAVSLWRGIPLEDERTVLKAEIINSMGGVNSTNERIVHFVSTPARVEFVPGQSALVADGVTRPVVAIRVLDKNGRPVRAGISGEFTLNDPYQSAEQLEQQQLQQLTGLGSSSARWIVDGNDGIARIELAPTMVSGSLRLEFQLGDERIQRRQMVETWIEPGDIEWTIVGLAEGSIGERTVADNMERTGRFDSDLGDKARVALYAKGRVLGKYLVTLAYDSAKQREDQRVLGALDPNAYYTVFADASSRRFDAPSREKLYVRIESSTFYALYGDFQSGFDQTQLARYVRTATGVKAEARLGNVHAQGFAAEIATRFRRDEIQGAGISGPYSLGSRVIIANSERVAIETRDRFRSEIVVERRELTRFLDYDIDLLSGTITFKQPIASRDFDLNPQFIVVEYEVDELSAGGEFNAGLRTDWTSNDGKVRIGATAITDKGDGPRTMIGAVDARLRLNEQTEIRAELALSRSDGKTSNGWLVEAQHQSGKLDILAYARSADRDYGVGQQSGAELGRRKIGVDARVTISERLSLVGSAWQDDSLTDPSRRRAFQVQGGYRSNNTDLTLGLSYFFDRLADGTTNDSTVLEAGARQRLFDNKLELTASSSIALDQADSIDLPATHRFGARYAITPNVKLVGLYEIADGENIDARTLRGGIEVTPWNGAQIVTSLGKQRIGESGNRSFAAFGLSQTLQVTPSLSLDATIDGNRTIGGSPGLGDIVNPAQPVAAGGHLGQDGSLFEDFTAFTLGASWRKDYWSLTARGEYRDGEFANRKGFTFGAIRQLGQGSMVGSGFTWTKADGDGSVSTEILDAAIAFAHRPDGSDFAMLGKLEYRSDSVTNAVAGEAGPAGRTALTVTGDAQSKRLIASLSTNWSPVEVEDGKLVRRSELGLFLGARYNFDRFEGFDLDGFTGLAGVDARLGLSERFDIGATGTVRANLTDNTTSFSFGPQVDFTPVEGMLLTVGYNVSGFRDPDFSAARHTDKGFYASVRLKFDADSFAFLGRGR